MTSYINYEDEVLTTSPLFVQITIADTLKTTEAEFFTNLLTKISRQIKKVAPPVN